MPLLVFTETLNTFPLKYFFVSALNPPENMCGFLILGYWAFLAMFCHLTLLLKVAFIIR